MRRRRIMLDVATYLALAALIIVLVFPIYWMFATSIRPRGEVLTAASILPDWRRVSFDAYRQALTLTNKPMRRWMETSTKVTVATVAVSMVAAIFGGYALSRFRMYRENTVLGYALLVIRMLPSVLLIIPLYVVFMRLGMLDNLFALVIAYATHILPFGIWMMKSFFDGIPAELEHAAQVDGCSLTGSLFRVVLPLSLPGITATAIYSAVLSWTEYLFASVFLTNRHFTVTVGVTTYIEEYVVNWNGLMAASLIGVLPVVAAFVFMERYLVQGLTAGAIK
jgi:multiple sugar transport system permease protein